MNPSSPAAPSLWTWTRWSSPPLPPPPCRGCSPSGLSPKGNASIPLPHPPLTPTSRAAKPTTRSQRACCSWPRTGAKRGRRRRRRRAKEGVQGAQVENMRFHYSASYSESAGWSWVFLSRTLQIRHMTFGYQGKWEKRASDRRTSLDRQVDERG